MLNAASDYKSMSETDFAAIQLLVPPPPSPPASPSSSTSRRCSRHLILLTCRAQVAHNVQWQSVRSLPHHSLQQASFSCLQVYYPFYAAEFWFLSLAKFMVSNGMRCYLLSPCLIPHALAGSRSVFRHDCTGRNPHTTQVLFLNCTLPCTP